MYFDDDFVQIGQELQLRVKLRKPRRKRRPSFARMAKLARKLGLDVEVTRDGGMTLKASSVELKPETVNPWDEVL